MRADGPGEVLAHGSAADDDENPRKAAYDFRRRLRHSFHRRGHQCGEPYEIERSLFGLFENTCGGDVLPQVDHCETVALENRADDVLPQVVQVSFNSGEEHSPLRRDPTRSLHELHSEFADMLRGLRRRDKLGKEEGAAVVALPHLFKRGNDSFVHNVERGCS